MYKNNELSNPPKPHGFPWFSQFTKFWVFKIAREPWSIPQLLKCWHILAWVSKRLQFAWFSLRMLR